MYITTDEELKNFCGKLINTEYISIDTEFIRQTTYYPKLCLIQISNGNYTAVIDVLSHDLNLGILNELLQNSSIVKVFHSAKQDLENFLILNGFLPKNIFDTQIAASLCGLGGMISYESLVEQLLTVKIDKKHCLSDWSSRPLSKEQMQYAILDVTYLFDIYPKLIALLEEKKRLTWALEEMDYINKPDNFIVNPENAWRKLKDFNGLKIDILVKKLAAWREIKSQQKNIPRNHFLHEREIFKLAKIRPISLNEFKNLKGFDRINQQEKEEIISIIHEALDKQIIIDFEDNKDIFLSKINSKVFLKLKNALQIVAEQYDLNPSFIANVEDLKRLSIEKSQLDLSNRALKGWRKEIFGKIALQIIENINEKNAANLI